MRRQTKQQLIDELARELQMALEWLDNAAATANKQEDDDPFWNALPNNWGGRLEIRRTLDKVQS